MPQWLRPDEYAVLIAACETMFPASGTNPGAGVLGVADYIDGLLGAFTIDPPRIWAGGPVSGRQGGEPGFDNFHSLSRLDEMAWRTRIEGSQGIPEREFNGPVAGYQQIYRDGLSRLGGDFATAASDERRRRLEDDLEFAELLFEHGCEGMYGAPEYGGNRDGLGWSAVGFTGDVQPRGWTDDEVSLP